MTVYHILLLEIGRYLVNPPIRNHLCTCLVLNIRSPHWLLSDINIMVFELQLPVLE